MPQNANDIGGGLNHVYRALSGYSENPQLLDSARVRFSESPPPYQSQQSETTTVLSTGSETAEEALIRKWKDRKVQLKYDRQNSLPSSQFRHELKEEGLRLWKKATEHDTGYTTNMPWHYKYDECWKAVEDHWREEGIWSDKYTPKTLGNWRWKHELALESSSQSEVEEERSTLFGPQVTRKRKSRTAITETERQQKRARREKEREASRPFHRFFYQCSLEIATKLRGMEPYDQIPTDIVSQVLQQRRKLWKKAKIWDERWGIVPGMQWMHEVPLQQLYDYYAPPPQLLAAAGDRGATADAAPRDLEPTQTHLFGPPSPTRPASGDATSSTRQRADADRRPATSSLRQALSHAELPNAPAQQLNSPPPCCSAALRRSRRKPQQQSGSSDLNNLRNGGNQAQQRDIRADSRMAQQNGNHGLSARAPPRRSARVAGLQTAADGSARPEISVQWGQRKRKAMEDAPKSSERSKRRA